MKTIYVTQEYQGFGKQNYYRNEYRVSGDHVFKYKCHRQKAFNGHENRWSEEERIEDSWSLDDPNMPEWLRKYL